jgi:hypothetical protein
MLVLHPSTLMATDGPLGIAVSVGVGVDVSVFVGIVDGWFVFVAVKVEVAISGVEVATPITTGVDVNIDGVGVEGRKGVGPGRGWITQPLQDDNRSIRRIGRINFFIFCPLCSLYPASKVKQSSLLVLLWDRADCHLPPEL